MGLAVEGVENLPAVAQGDDRAGVSAGDVAEDTVRPERYQLQGEA
jgi:hypothetical protein